MKMFDWDDQELANILWGEDREADDHIVPYPEDDEKKDQPDHGEFDKKKLNEEGTTTNVAEKRLKLFSDRDIAEKNDGVSASGTFADPQLDSPSFATLKTDDNAIAKKTELDICPEVSGNQDEDKELGEFVRNGWANIGSFDDLDRIFSNDELDGHTSLGRGDDLWLSSKDLMSGVANSSSGAVGSRSWEFGALGNTSSQIEFNSEYMHDEHPPESTSFEYTGSIMSNTRHKTTRFEKQQEYTADTSGLTEEKDDWSKSQLKHQQMTDMMTDSVLSEDVYDTWPSSATISNFSASVPCQQQLPHESGPIAYQRFQNAYVAPYVFRNFPQQYSATRMLNPTSNEHQSIRPGAEVNQGDVISFNKHAETTARAMKMTPQEKIEKLRRRQQMRAMLAIQKQQQQLSHQASVDHPLSQESLQEDQFLHMEKAELEADECLNNLPGCDPGSPNKKEDLCTFSDIDECSAEDTALFQLQDIIAKLDTKIRLCIKDSLYRLADSATQRHYASGMNAAKRSSTSDSEIMNEDISSHHRTAGNADMEAETNHIDRAVAHLLFHRPFKSSVKPAETPVSSTSNRACAEQEIAGSSLPSVLLSKSSEKICNPPLPEPTTPLPFVNSCHEDMLKDVSQNETSLDQQTERKMDEDDD